jgi:hypothetical protein
MKSLCLKIKCDFCMAIQVSIYTFLKFPTSYGMWKIISKWKKTEQVSDFVIVPLEQWYRLILLQLSAL